MQPPEGRGSPSRLSPTAEENPWRHFTHCLSHAAPASGIWITPDYKRFWDVKILPYVHLYAIVRSQPYSSTLLRHRTSGVYSYFFKEFFYLKFTCIMTSSVRFFLDYPKYHKPRKDKIAVFYVANVPQFLSSPVKKYITRKSIICTLQWYPQFLYRANCRRDILNSLRLIEKLLPEIASRAQSFGDTRNTSPSPLAQGPKA